MMRHKINMGKYAFNVGHSWLMGVLSVLVVASAVLALVFRFYGKAPAESVVEHNVRQMEEYILAEKQSVDALLKVNIDALERCKSFDEVAQQTVLFSSAVAVRVYYLDSLIFWNENRIPNLTSSSFNKRGLSFVVLNNGYYLVYMREVLDRKFCAFIPLKNAYSFTNNYLTNTFLMPMYLPEKVEMLPPIYLQANRKGAVRCLSTQEILFQIRLKTQDQLLVLADYEVWSAYSFLLSVFFLVCLYFAYVRLPMVQKRPIWELGKWIVLVCGLRAMLFYERDFMALSAINNFSPAIFATSTFVPSLGDLMLHFFCFVSIVVFIIRFRVAFNWWFRWFFARYPMWFVLIANAFVYAYFSFLSFDIVDNLVLNSTVPLNLTDFYHLNRYTYYTFLLVLIIIFSNSGYVSFIYHFLIKKNDVYLSFTFFCLVSLLLGLFLVQKYIALQYCIYGLIQLAVLFAVVHLFPKVKTSELYLSLLTCICLLVGFQFNQTLFQKKINTAKILSQKIYNADNPLAEALIKQAAIGIQKNLFIKKSLLAFAYNKNNLKERIQIEYLTGYLNRFSVSELNFKPYSRMPKGFEADTLLADSLFDAQWSVLKKGVILKNPIIEPKNTSQKFDYKVKIPIQNRFKWFDTLQIELAEKTIKPDSPFPDLLMEGSILNDVLVQNNQFSFAIYQQGQLLKQSGDFPYTLSYMFPPNQNRAFSIYRESDYVHLSHIQDNQTNTVVVTLPTQNWTQWFNTSAILFLLSAVIYILFWLAGNILLPINFFDRLSYENKIIIYFITTVLLILIVLGYVTINYTIYKNRKYHNELITKRIQNISSYLEADIKNINDLENSSKIDFLTINQLAKTYNIDLVLYQFNDRNGNKITPLVAVSTLNKMFDAEIISNLINPKAYLQIITNKRTIVTQDETIGKLNYTSLYIPVKNSNNQIAGILNIPSYSMQKDIQNDVNAFLGSLLNIYVFCLILMSFLAFALAKRITKPIRLLAKAISYTKMGAKRTVIINPKRRDEISNMLREYNLMLLKLEQTAELLAQSEKDAAWRQMARQVAHEIRNPLTPMKLSIQHLQRAARDKNEHFDALLGRVSQTVLEQIDSLERISGEFSAFAQIKISNIEPFDLTERIQNAINLFADSACIEFHNAIPSTQNTDIAADKEQIARVFNNLFKNALQAAADHRPLEINVYLYQNGDQFVVEIEDNGKGIPNAIQDQIFAPNFTTKTSGMGLGLAIVKKICETNKVNITFSSLLQKGTIFALRFNKIEENQILN